jgi:hypothetical protein
MGPLTALVYWAGVVLCLPSAFLLLEIATGLLTRKRSSPASSGPLPNAVLLIPAHNEEALLGDMLARLSVANEEAVRTIVIADNCTDSTATIARDAGIEVWERSHETLRGKPYALEWALERLAEDPPEVVVFLDADSWFEQGHPAELARQVQQHNRPVQAIYRMADPGLRGFAFRFRNEARLRGLSALGAPTQLTGSGFAVAWQHLVKHPVPIGELVEDAYWGWTFTRAGIGPRLATQVEVLSYLPSSKEGAQTQLRRWEHGILSATLRNLPGLLRSAFLPPRPPRIFHLLDVLVPPLALLALSILAVFAVGALLGFGLEILPVSAALGCLAAAVFLGWLGYGRQDISFMRLLGTPFYALGKIGVYVTFLFKRQKGWDRTDRDDS